MAISDAANSVNFSGKNTHSCNTKDIYKDTPVRYLGFTNELGAAAGNLCKSSSGIVKHIPALSYVPALLYIGADTFDKFSKGKEEQGVKHGLKMGTRELISQVIGSVLAPTGVVIATQKICSKAAKTVAPVLPKNIKNIGTSLKNIKGIGKFLPKSSTMGKIALTVISLGALLKATKPIDEFTERIVLNKVVDPLLKIKPQNNE